MARVLALVSLVAIAIAGWQVSNGSAQSSFSGASKKTCHYHTKWIKGKKHRVKVCTVVKPTRTPNPTPTLTATARPSSTPTATARPSATPTATASPSAIPTPTATRTSTTGAIANPIVMENQRPGTADWRVGKNGYLVADDTNQQIKGYASAPSVNKGQQLTFYVTTHPAQAYSIAVYRLGYYQGLGARLVQQLGPLTGISQSTCPVDSTTGLISCNWIPGYSVTVPNDWVSGIYLAVLTNSRRYQNYVSFVVRDDERRAAILYQQPVTTYEAYNDFPDDHLTGKSLYGFNSFGANTVSGTPRAVKVSFDRPYSDDGAEGPPSGAAQSPLTWEFDAIQWLEEKGYDVTYSTDVDTHTNGGALLNYKALLSVGHDEYWSNEMYNAWQNARDNGVNLAILGSNTDYWQIRFEASASGVRNRVIVCYKQAALDPVQGRTTTVNWRDRVLNRPEQALLGGMFTTQLQNSGYTSYVVSNSQHWIYNGTRFANGDRVPGIVGYEVDRSWPTYASPRGSGYQLLSASPVISSTGRSDLQNSTIYQAPSGAWVFNAGTMGWSWGLMGSRVNSGIQRTTQNLLDTFLDGGTPPPSQLSATDSRPGVTLRWKDNANNETGFTIERSVNGVTWTRQVSALPANSESYVVSGLEPGKYYYRVRANNAVGCSDWSTAISQVR